MGGSGERGSKIVDGAIDEVVAQELSDIVLEVLEGFQDDGDCENWPSDPCATGFRHARSVARGDGKIRVWRDWCAGSVNGM